MRRMFSKNQIEKLAKEVADHEIENAEINVSQLGTDSDNQGKFLQVQNDGSIIPATISGGTQLYRHRVLLASTPFNFYIDIISNIDSEITSIVILASYLNGWDGVNPIFSLVNFESSSTERPVFWISSDTLYIYKKVSSKGSDNELIETLSNFHPSGSEFTSIISDTVSPL